MRIASTKDDISSIFTPGMLACAFAYAALKLVGSITNGYLYPLVATTDGWIREISTLVIAEVIVALVIRTIIKSKKAGKSLQCGMDCSHCKGCH